MFFQLLAVVHISPKWLQIDRDNLRMKFLAYRTFIFNNVSIYLLNLRNLPYGGLKFWYSFNTHYYFIACCT